MSSRIAQDLMLGQVLSGLKVVDLTQNVAGPYCTQVLGDLGADVIKVERPGRGDDTRDWRPPETGGQSATFLALNRNKRSICVDLDSPDGVDVLRRLVTTADIVVHSMKPGSAEARGLGYEELKRLNPRLIYVAISAFGSVGPLRHLPGYDPLMQAFTGIMSTTGHEGQDPVRVGVSLIDMGTGLWSALGILAAVIERSRSGRGVLVEASLLETGVTWMTVFVAGYLATASVPRKLGSAMSMTTPYQVFRSVDGHVFIAAGNDGLFRRVCQGLGAADLADDPRFVTNPSRLAHRAELHQALEARTCARTTADLVEALRRAGAPCSELNDVAQMLAHEQVDAVDLVRPLPVDGAPDHRVVALPLKADGLRSSAMRAPPGLGADTAAVLAALGVDDGEVARLKSTGRDRLNADAAWSARMDHAYTDTQQDIRLAMRKLCEEFGPDCWLRCEEAGAYPEEFVAAVTVTLHPRAGGQVSRTVVVSPDSFRDPITPDQLRAKWTDGLRRAKQICEEAGVTAPFEEGQSVLETPSIRGWLTCRVPAIRSEDRVSEARRP